MEYSREKVFELLAQVKDPEIPVLSVIDMGIVRDVEVNSSQGSVRVSITPTYSGCPAMKMIEDDIVQVLREAGVASVSVDTVLAPAWTTDWLTAEAKEKLRQYGIAPPKSPVVTLGREKLIVACPFCASKKTERRSDFGSTPCKTFYFCRECEQPFEYFKAI